jgi:methionyl aminopeptidase
MVLAIEPMVNMGRAAVRVLDDGWTAVTQDGSLSAHFEHTVAVVADGPVVLSTPSEQAGRDEVRSGSAARAGAEG